MRPERRLELRVGLFVLLALVLFAAAVFVIGRKESFFVPKARYLVRFASVGGLREGSSVQLNGIVVGKVEQVLLPPDTGALQLEVRIAIDRRFAQRVRADSIARIKTLGLLGDKYVEITSGSPAFAQIALGGVIRAAEPTNVDQLMASGEDVVANVVGISHSLAGILDRLERGEGMLGQLVHESPSGRNVGEEVMTTLDSVRRAVDTVGEGRGAIYRLSRDRELGDRLASAIGRLDRVLAEAESGAGPLPALLSDAALRQRLESSLDRLGKAADDLAAVAASLRTGDSLLARAATDEAWGREVTEDLRAAVKSLRSLAEKLDRGDGTAARLVNDPSVYEAIQDVVVGIDESPLLRWLVRNRQQAGIEKRARDAGAPDPLPTPSASPPPGLR